MALDLLDLTLLLGITVYLTLCWHGLELFRKHFLAGCVLRLLSIACVQITLGMSWFGHCRKTDVALLILSRGGDWRYFSLRRAWRLLSVFCFSINICWHWALWLVLWIVQWLLRVVQETCRGVCERPPECADDISRERWYWRCDCFGSPVSAQWLLANLARLKSWGLNGDARE